MPNPEFQNTDRITKLLREGKRAEARAVRNAQWDKAQTEVEAGKTICLSDLLAGDEAFVIDSIEKGQGA
jgi:hypothetical protein